MNIGITYQQVRDGEIHWSDIARATQGDQLLGWVEWEIYKKAEEQRKK